MKKNLLIYQIVFSVFILSFSSCINQSFDFDDEKLDTNVTLGNSVNLPVGNIEKISVYKELQKLYDKLEVGDDGVLYIKYDDKFPVEFPDFEVPKIAETERQKGLDKLISQLGGKKEISLSYLSSVLELTSDTIENYDITKEDPELGDDFEFETKKIEFSSLILKAGFKLSDISLTPVNNDAKVVVTLTFPNNYTLANESNDIEMEVPFVEVIKGEIYYPLLGEIKVNSYTLGDDGNLTYTVALKKENAEMLKIEKQPSFTLIIEAEEEPNPPTISYLQGKLKGTKSFTGEEVGFEDLQDAFSSDDVLEFRNPSLTLDLATNLGANFKLGLELLKNADSDNKISASLDGENLLSFEKPEWGSTETYQYHLDRNKLVGFNEIISTPFPEKLDYTVNLIFDSDEAKLPQSDQLELSVNYSFKIPFDFEKINLSLKDTITNLFNEDIYEQVFSHTKESVSIEADKVDVSIGNGGINLKISAAILDSDFNEIINWDSALAGDKLSIDIKGNDLEKMKDARHLKFMFNLSGEGAIKEDDYIQIKGVRLVSGSGIHYEF